MANSGAVSADTYGNMLQQMEVPVIGIFRGINIDAFGSLMQVSFSTGLQAIEVTMNTAGAGKIIAANRDNVPTGKYLGMGTIRNLDEAERAYEAGAMFFVTPNFNPDVIKFARSKNIPVVVGALTPTEIYRAWNEGASMVKVFPCRALGGPQYIKELRGPFEQIPLVAVGGVTLQTINGYLQAGAAAVGVGISLFGEEAVKTGDWDAVGENVEKLIRCCKTA
jgi:2-dehydro-3-deoxyphosphogluconate aldolase/(4S)-4-hydroxy-2-oxoglutarate aldolase